MRRTTILSVAVTLACLGPAPAAVRAAVVVGVETVDGKPAVILVGDDAPNKLLLDLKGFNRAVPTIEFTSDSPVTSESPECVVSPDGLGGECARPDGQTGYGSMFALGAGGNDDLQAQGADSPALIPAILDGGPGNDRLGGRVNYNTPANLRPVYVLDGGDGADQLSGGNGDDILGGGPGNDGLNGAEGSDRLDGGEGDDKVSDTAPDADDADVFIGGPGYDAMDSLSFFAGTDTDIALSLDGQANDGIAGEGDNVMPDMEQTKAQGRVVTFSGSPGPDRFSAFATQTSTISGLGGDDVLSGYDGRDTIDGGDGDDTLVGGFGPDTITGGAGIDLFDGDGTERDVVATGADTIRAADGNAESVACGVSGDTVTADVSDTVGADCETVTRVGTPPPPPPLPSPPPPPPPAVNAVQRFIAQGLTRTARCKAFCRVSATLTVGGKPVAGGNAKRATRGTVTVRIRVTAAGRRTLTARRSFVGRLTLLVRDRKGRILRRQTTSVRVG